MVLKKANTGMIAWKNILDGKALGKVLCGGVMASGDIHHTDEGKQSSKWRINWEQQFSSLRGSDTINPIVSLPL